MGMLFGSGGAARSRQFAVTAQLLRGEHGGIKRGLTLVAFACLGLGTWGTFAGVASITLPEWSVAGPRVISTDTSLVRRS
jgi:hypothetical protein